MDNLIVEHTTDNKSTKMALTKETPLMKQYKSIKAQYPDAILLFRVGDFMKPLVKMPKLLRKCWALY